MVTTVPSLFFYLYNNVSRVLYWDILLSLLIPQVRPAHKYPISPWEMIQLPVGDNASVSRRDLMVTTVPSLFFYLYNNVSRVLYWDILLSLLIPQVRPAHKYPISPWEMIQLPVGDNALCAPH
jgi:hypothetical protein